MNSFEKISVVGAGSVGGFYGAKIAREHDLSFLMRRDLNAVRKEGLKVESPNGNFHLKEVKSFASTTEIGPVDLVIVALKTTANEYLPDLIPPLLHERTVILTLQNGLGNEGFLARHFPNYPVLGGLCFVCINRGEPGVIQHIAHGHVEMGSLDPANTNLAEDATRLFCESEIDCSVLPDLDLARWRKLVWNIPFNGLAVAEGGIDVARIMSNPRLELRAKDLMLEVIGAAGAQGYKIDSAFAETNMEWSRTMGPYRPSSLIDFLEGQPVEVEAIFGEPLRRAKSAGYKTPELEKLYLEISDKTR